jgi:hypothetical protein
MNRYTKWSFLSVLWLANPIYFTGCFQSDDPVEPNFEPEELDALLEGVNENPWRYERNDQAFEIQFALETIGETAAIDPLFLFSSAHACAESSIFAQAEACMDISYSYRDVEGVVTILDAETKEVVQQEIAVSGTMEVWGSQLELATLELTHSDGQFSFNDDPEEEGAALDLVFAEW